MKYSGGGCSGRNDINPENNNAKILSCYNIDKHTTHTSYVKTHTEGRKEAFEYKYSDFKNKGPGSIPLQICGT